MGSVRYEAFDVLAGRKLSPIVRYADLRLSQVFKLLCCFLMQWVSMSD